MNPELGTQILSKNSSIPDLNQHQKELMKKALDGDQEALNEIVVFYYPYVARIARLYFLQYRANFFYEDDFDIVQNVMMRFQNILENYANLPSQSNFSGFLKGCIRNVTGDMSRKNQSRKKYNTPDDLEEIRGKITKSHSVYFPPGQEKNIHELRYRHDDSIENHRKEIRTSFLEFQKKHPELAEIIFHYYWLGIDDAEMAVATNHTKNQIWRERKKALKELKAFVVS